MKITQYIFQVFFPYSSKRKNIQTYSSMSTTAKGVIFGIIAAVCYGFVPTFTLPVSLDNPLADADCQMNTPSILFYRFIFAAILIGIYMWMSGKSFRVSRGELVTLIYLSFLSDGSALFLISGYKYMTSGVATVLHFTYPIFTALLMMTFYHEARKASTLFAVVMAVAGVTVLSWQGDGEASLTGIIIVLISAVCYALYLIRVNRSRVKDMDVYKLTFYVMLIGGLIFGAQALQQNEIQPIGNINQALNLALLAIVCTLISNLSLVAAVKNIGSTFTSILGALEPLTAVVLGLILFSEPITANIVVGLLLIIPSVVIIIITRGRNETNGK